eukprot:CAMPEP_0201545676 /NCGR_PEP_ID=MMETSP0173_2-20130828/2116_1 /ASSEMBLY_ACC=CAM_ASM_000268 /TAXON_ID=218659 /ORGANISM="Vexillifera sp., Strain DIVA3 564/2" /LENGTH=164 /DNA_ID=CAMNT_0047954141 /DNA_START=36 /DNA_END=530 /DNA_ORIENTATION=+
MATDQASATIVENKSQDALTFLSSRSFLVCLDGSPSSKLALDYAIELAVPSKLDTLVLLSVAANKADAEKNVTEAAERVEEFNELLKTTQKEGHYQVQLISIEKKDPRDAIVETAAKEYVDFITMGTRGLSSIKGMMLGSVSSHVSQHAPCPVLLVREPSNKKK